MQKNLIRIFVILSLLLGAACRTTRKSPPSIDPGAGSAQNSEPRSERKVARENPVVVEKSRELAIAALEVQVFTFKGNTMPFVAIDFSGKVDYFRYRHCSDAVKCPPTITASKSLVIPGLPPGTYQLEVQACREEATAQGSSLRCGPWKSVPFTQVANPDQQLDGWLKEKTELERKIKNLGINVIAAVKSYRDAVKTCSDPRVVNLMSSDVVNNFILLGPGVIGFSLLDPAAQMILQDSGDNAQVVLPTLASSEMVGTFSKSANQSAATPTKTEADTGKNIAATVTTVAGAGALASGVMSTIAKEQVLKAGKGLSKEAGQAVAAQYERLSSQYSTAAKGLKVIALGSLLYYFYHNTDDVSASELIKEFAKNAMLVGGQDPCLSAAEAIQTLSSVDKQAHEMRLEIARLQQAMQHYQP